jgi:lipoic acid synthetase
MENKDKKIMRKPDWIRVKAPLSKEFAQTKALMNQKKLYTVCEEAACPNIGECWKNKVATFLILGDLCTRNCAFCNISKGNPHKIVDENEPQHVLDSVKIMGLKHVVITSVTRDDLIDGGAGQFVECIELIKRFCSNVSVEVLTPDFMNKEGALEAVITAKPDVFNHNLETVPRLYKTIRPIAKYTHSLSILKKAKQLDGEIFTKSGIMLGLGEEKEEVLSLMDDLRASDVDFITIGQYLRPSMKHAPIARYLTPAEFENFQHFFFLHQNEAHLYKQRQNHLMKKQQKHHFHYSKQEHHPSHHHLYRYLQ